MLMMQSYICNHSELHIVKTCLQFYLDTVVAWLCSSCLGLNVANKRLHASVGDNRLTLQVP